MISNLFSRSSRPKSTDDGEAWLVVGLGNPGPRYAANRHNVGRMVVDVLAERMDARFRAHKSRCDIAEGLLAGRRVILAKPVSYMNESGGPVAAVSRFFKISPEKLIIVYDELDIPYGTLRLRYSGGTAGHNGLRSVERGLGTRDFLRVRFGIGRPPGRVDPAAHVLRDFSAPEREELPLQLDRAADAVTDLIEGGLGAAQNTYHVV